MIDEVRSPVEERPHCPKSGEQDKFGSHCRLDVLDLVLGRLLRCHKDLGSVRSNNILERRDKPSEWESHALDDEERNVRRGIHSALDTCGMVLRKAELSA